MKRSGFSLVELSIVLVILGLLVGGILAGQSLIRASELRAVTTEHSRYLTAINAFKDQYFGLPGDMPNATKFWGAIDPTPATCRGTSSTTIATCDGNGDGLVWTMDSYVSFSEAWHFWKQMANAGLIEGSYHGGRKAGNAVPYSADIGANVPASKLPGSGWSGYHPDALGDATNWYTYEYGNTLTLGAASSGNMPVVPNLKPEEAWNIDKKIDDGKPGRGKMIVFKHSLCAGTSGPTDYAADYALSNTTIACSLLFPNAF